MQTTPQIASQSSTRTLLIVDDHDQVRSILKCGFETLGYAVDVAGDGVEALGLLSHSRYDAVLCDLLMPNMCGQELFRHCCDRHPENARRFIFLSGSPGELQGMVHEDAAIQPRVDKPCRLAELQAAIEQVAP